MGESEDPIYRIICETNTDYSLAIRGGQVVFALINPFDRYQHWIKDEKHGATIKDSKGQPAFAVVNRATGQAISHGPTNEEAVPLVQYNMISRPLVPYNTISPPLVPYNMISPPLVPYNMISPPLVPYNMISPPLVPYNMISPGESVLWTMSKEIEGFGNIRRKDLISVNWRGGDYYILDGYNMYLSDISQDYQSKYFNWKFEKVSPSSCITLFRPSQHTVKIICQGKVGYNLAIDKDGSTVLLVPANPKDKYQHWIKEMAHGVPVKEREWEEAFAAFALVNKATGKAIKHGFGHNYLVQVAPFNQNYMDSSLLWTVFNHQDGFQEIRMKTNVDLVFNIFDEGLGNSLLLGLSKTGSGAYQKWKIEDFE